MLASPEQARIITMLENDGVAHVALVSRGNDTLAEELLSLQAQSILETYHPELLEETAAPDVDNRETARETAETSPNPPDAETDNGSAETKPAAAQN